MDISRSQLAWLTAGKTVVSTAVRWLPFFLPTLAIAFATTTSQLTVVLGFGEMAGLSTLLIGRHLDAGRERWIMVGALGLITVASLLALVGDLWVFAVAYVVLIIGMSAYTVAGHTYFSRRIPYQRRARTIGTFETSWALSLLLGAPLAALAISWFGWRAPFAILSGLAVVMAVILWRRVDNSEVMSDAKEPAAGQRLNANAWILIAASACTATTGLTTIVIVGTWLSDELGVSTGGIGLIVMAFGAAELTASTSSAAIADRAGPMRSTRVALVIAIVGLIVMTQAMASLAIGAIGLFLFFLGFEFAIVTSFSIVSEAMPAARGRTLATNNAVSTVARGCGIVASGVLYEQFGIKGPAAISITTAVIGLMLLSIGLRRSQHNMNVPLVALAGQKP